jgi:predicted O-methyltransferase YrrM
MNCLEKLQEQGRKRDQYFPNLINEMKYEYAAEIGVDQGIFSNVLLEKTNLKKLYCIDIWQNSVKKQKAIELLKKHESRIEIYQGLSTATEILDKIQNNSLDYVYIDGDHSLEGIFYDMRAWIQKIRIGGIMSGHDYTDGRASGTIGVTGKNLRKKVKPVVDDFCIRYGYKLFVTKMNWLFFKNRECDTTLRLNY